VARVKIRDGNVLIFVHADDGQETASARRMFEDCEAPDAARAGERSVRDAGPAIPKNPCRDRYGKSPTE
jgi:hypothetical protein